MQVQQRFPVQILDIDSDKGGEFINYHLCRYCHAHNIAFTRSRPHRKNDNCFVEQKNNSVVRRYLGYFRYENDEQLKVLNDIYQRARLLINYYYPSQKLISKHRSGPLCQDSFRI